MRVLICIATMETGGAERQVTYLAKSLIQQGVDVHVMLLRKGTNFNRLTSSGANIHFWKPSRFLLPSMITLVREFKRISPEIVYLWLDPFSVYGWLAGRTCRIPVIHAERTDPCNFTTGLKSFARHRVIAWSDGVITNSQAGADYWQCYERSGQFVVKIPNIIPIEELASVGAAKESENCVLTVGRLDENKNVLSLLMALRLLRDNNVSLQLLIAGEGPLRPSLEAFVTEHNLVSCVRFLGHCDNAWELMKGCQVFVSLSGFEGEPNAVAEACALGCDLILSDIPAHRRLSFATFATFVRKDDIEQIASALRQTTREPSRPKQIRAHDFADRSEAVVSGQHIDVFQSRLNIH